MKSEAESKPLAESREVESREDDGREGESREEEDGGFRWTPKLWLSTLLGGWLALALLAGFLHLMLGDFRAIDLGGAILGLIWTMALVFAGVEERVWRR